MSIRDLFLETDNKLLSKDPSELRNDAESIGNITATRVNRDRFIPKIDFSDPANFANFGSAESYYEDAITRIYENYPYDGSSKEKQEYLNESTYIDLWMLENKYPRTNGYIILSALDGTSTSVDDGWENPTVQEYISFVGGPHTASQGMIGKPLSSTFDDSNKYDEDIYDDVGFTGTGTRESNLKTNFDNGVTVEFWFTTEQTQSRKHTIFDLWNSTTGSASSYGRLNIAYDRTNSKFSLTAESGSTGINEELIGQDLSTLQNSFHHYAFRFYNSGSNLNVDFYIDGQVDAQETYAGQSMNEITGALTANIGALTSPFVDGSDERGDLGWGKMSGSLDEFRFWKSKRTSEDIGRYWFDQVYGGTNTDIANAELGVYFKFNEGITGNSSIDSTVLDYSGRITNGAWTGYDTSARNTGSAIVLANAATSEFMDPIIYSEHPEVQAVITEMRSSGSAHDYVNNAALYNGFPLWILEDDNDNNGELKKLTQIMSSYLDTLQLQIQELPKLQNIDYFSGSYTKEYPFMADLLEGRGLVAKDIFADATVLEQIFSRSETDLYSSDLTDVKNLIYRNIYNNLVYIYKSKGTEKSFRNLIRCYGIDDSLINLNLYANNLTYELENTYEFDSEKKRYADFYDPSFFESTVYQQTSSTIANSVSFISASGADQEKYSSFTLEADVLLPRKRKETDINYFSTNFSTSSLFGFHTADSSSPTDFTWPATDYDLKAYIVRPPDNDNLKDAYFLLTSSYFGLNLTSSLIKDAYDNKRWNVSVRVYPEKLSDLISGSATTDYIVDFSGIQKELDVTSNEFRITGSLSTPEFLTQPKRIYAAAHRQDFSGSILEKTDVKLGFVRYWMSELSDTELESHAQDPTNYGKEHPLRGINIYDTSLDNIEVPQAKTLALDWGWDIISTSSAGGKYNLLDKSSGSAADLDKYGWLSNVSERQHTGIGDYNPASTRVVNVEYVPIARTKDPESLNSTLTSIKILNEFEEEVFDRNTRPTNFYYTLEKSMYSSISKEMLRYFATIVDFNNLIGEPVNKYRSEYKDMAKLRQLFYENVQNEPQVEKFIEYYRWIDQSLSSMLMQLVPASSQVTDGVRNIIESHVLERNKYRNKLATLGRIDTDISGGLYGVERSAYAWKFGTPTLPASPPPTNEHCFWWKFRADRTNYRITSGDAAVDATRNAVLAAAQSKINRSYFSPVRVTMKKEDIYGSGINTSNNNIQDYVKSAIKFNSAEGLLFESSKVKDFLDCLDDIDPLGKKKWSYAGQNENDTSDYATSEGDLVAPFVAVSSSVDTGYNQTVNSNFKQGFSIENLHIDSYLNGETTLQGPFTEKYVGGKQSRHIGLNDGTDSATTRPEAWKLEFVSPDPAIRIINQPVDLPRAALYRGLTAKSPLNITNIKSNTTTGDVGNYSKDYEIVQTVSRTKNNVANTKAGGFNIVEIPSPYIAGMDDYEKPDRGRTEHVFVNRFSSPGSPDTAGDSNGGPALDTFAAEFSPYNNINYRNTSIRDIYTLLQASHVNQFGFYSDNFGIGAGPSQVSSENYNGTGSIYQVNRNTIKQLKDSGSTTVTASVYDNFFVQHPIPRSDLQYAWITSSYMSYDTFGYLPYSGEVSSSAGETSLVTFSSASDFGSYQTGMFGRSFGIDKSLPSATNFLPTVYNGLNYNVYEPSNRNTGFLGYQEQEAGTRVRVDIDNYKNTTLVPIFGGDGSESLLNALLLKRNGPYQHPTWKQIRNYDNPIVKNRRQNGLTAYNIETNAQNGNLEQTAILPVNRYSATKIVKDPAVISKYKPLQFGLKISRDSDTGKDVITETVRAECVYGNEIGRFANNQITYDLLRNQITDKDTAYRAIYDMYSDSKILDSASPIEDLVYVTYSEQVYPSSINCYSKANRERIGYKNTFWKDSRSARTDLGQEKFGGNNSQGFSRDQSAWALDAADTFGEDLAVSNYYAYDYSSGSAGELQNEYTFFYRVNSTGSTSDLRPSPILSRKNEINSKYSVVTPTGMESIVTAATSTAYLTVFENSASAFSPFLTPFGVPLGRGGNAKFEAHTLAGYVKDGVFVSSSATPFYDKYEQYNLEMRLNNKDMSLVPEFRISEHIEKYLNDSNGYVSDNESSFSIFGINQQEDQTVSYTDPLMQAEMYDVQVGETAPSSSSENDFYRIYSFSDFMQHFEVINEDHLGYDLPKGLTLSCKALMKFIPYDGFYPAEHTLEIANAFSQSYSPYIDFSGSSIVSGSTTDPLRVRPIYETMFSPGILFNTIKSGIAVDYPVYTGSYDIVAYSSGTLTTIAALGTGSRGNQGWDYRIAFETLLEPEKLNNIPIMDMNVGVNTTRLTSLLTFSSASLDAPSGMNSYKLMMNNFLAEVPNFFLENGMTKFTSNKAENITPEPNTTYGMRVKMYRSMNKERVKVGDFMPPQDDINDSSLFETMTMYSRPTAFGPPVAGSDNVISGTLQADSTCGINPSFTPPYYNGECWAHIYYTSDATASAVTIEDIISSASVDYIRSSNEGSWPMAARSSVLVDYPYTEASYANNFSMQLSASMNLLARDASGNWNIQTKFETPMLNFGDKTKRPLNFNNITLPSTGTNGDQADYYAGYGGITTTPIGMWHQFGLIPEENQGIYTSIQDIDVEFLKNAAEAAPSGENTRSLIDLVGFERSVKKLGQIKDTKTVYESVVAVPFKQDRDCNKVFFEIDKESKDYADLESKMNKYVFPPQFDFLRNKKAKPLAMYVFEFEHTFDRDDLSYIWQNISPKFGTSYKTAMASISHPLLEGQKLADLSGQIRWMVFKVKQRAMTNYYDNLVNPPGPMTVSDNQTFSYNWPYDYFSMVEFAKIDSTVNFGKEPTEEIETKPIKAGDYKRESLSTDLAAVSSRTVDQLKQIDSEADAIVKSTKKLDKDKLG